MDLLALILAVMAGETTEQEISSAVSAWITAHPEAVTTVQDGAISRAKLDADLKEKTDAVGDLKSALNLYIVNTESIETTEEQASISPEGVVNPSGSANSKTAIIPLAKKGIYKITIGNRETACRAGFSNTFYSGSSITLSTFFTVKNGDELAIDPEYAYLYVFFRSASYLSATLSATFSAITDDTLTIENAPADAKETGKLKKDLKRVINSCDIDTPVSLSQTEIKTGNIYLNGICDHIGEEGFKTYFIPVDSENDLSVSVTASQSRNAFVAMMKSDTLTQGAVADFADETSLYAILAGETVSLYIPADCNYIAIRYLNSYNDYSPSSVSIKTCFVPKIDKTLSVSDDAADAKVVGDRLNIIDSMLIKSESVDFSAITVISGLINRSNKWSVSRYNCSYKIAVTKEMGGVAITANSTNPSVVAFLQNDNLVNGETPTYCTGTGRTLLTAGETRDFVIPGDCNYIVIIKSDVRNDYTPASMLIYESKTFESTIPLGLHEMPQNTNILNIIKRCRQLTDIKWTPAVDLPRFMLVQRGGAEVPETADTQNYLGTFKAGVEYTGVPYGRVTKTAEDYGYDFATVAHYIGFDTFISSIVNPKSRLSKENVSSVSQHRSVIYATVCSGLTCYALDVDEVPTANIGNIPQLTSIGKLNDNGIMLEDSRIKIGDVLNLYAYHTAIITDIIRDKNGIIQLVELSDASTAGLADRNYDDGQIGGICRRKGWTREQLYAAGSWGDYTVYRYGGNVSYTPSQYVNVGDEFNGWNIAHFPIMPYEGQGFVYKTGYIPNNTIKLVITLDGYSYVRVFKGGTEITGSPFAVTKDENDEINPIEITEIGTGEYTAYLCNITEENVVNMSYACKWTIT